MTVREQSIRREENARYLVCRNDSCESFEMKWRVNADGEPLECEDCGWLGYPPLGEGDQP